MFYNQSYLLTMDDTDKFHFTFESRQFWQFRSFLESETVVILSKFNSLAKSHESPIAPLVVSVMQIFRVNFVVFKNVLQSSRSVPFLEESRVGFC